MHRRLSACIVAAIVMTALVSGCISDGDDEGEPSGPSILDGLEPARGDVATVLETVDDPRVAADLVVIAELFNLTFPDQAAMMAERSGGNGSTTSNVAIHIWGDPHVRENLFTEVLFHTANEGDAIAAALNGRTLPSSSLATQADLARAMLAYGPSFNNRNAAWAMLTAIDLGGGTVGGEGAWSTCNYVYTSPLVLDMDGDGRLAASGGEWLPHPLGWSEVIRPFDLDGDGYEELTEWVGPGDGLLTTWTPASDAPLTANHLFGDAEGHANGYAKLAGQDIDGDGHIKAGELDGLSVWQDADGDAKPGTGEVRTAKELRITDIRLEHRQLRSAFVMDGKERLVWDWYPNALEAMRAPADAGGASPVIPFVAIGGLSRTAREASSGMASGESSRMTPEQLKTAGLGGMELVTVLDTGTAVLIGKGLNVSGAAIPGGSVLTMAMVHTDASGALVVRKIPLDVRDVQAVVPTPNMMALIVVTDGGGRLLEVELANSTVHTLFETPNDAGKASFRFGGALSVHEGRVYGWGAFHDPEGRVLSECVASFPWEGGHLTLHHDLRALFKAAGIAPTVGTVYSNESLMFASYEKDVGLWTPTDGRMQRVDGGTSFRGMWASSRGTLCLLKRPQGDRVEAVLYQPGGEPRSLGTGDFHYPVLSAHGKAAAVATYDIANMTMDILVGHPATKWVLVSLLEDVPIGPLRLSDEGRWYAHISSSGLVVDKVS